MKLPVNYAGVDEQLRRVTTSVNLVYDGKTDAATEVTLSASSATTVVINTRVSDSSVILFMPTTANAAAEVANGTMYVSSRGNQTFTITHANNAQSDRTFGYIAFTP